MKKIFIIFLAMFMLTIPAYAEAESEVYIPKNYDYMPEGYKDFMVIETGWAGNKYEIIFFNNTPIVKTSDTSSNKRLEVRGTDEKLGILAGFSTLEEIKTYMETGNTDKVLQKVQSTELYGRPEPYAISTTIPAYDNVVWQEHAGGSQSGGETTPDDSQGILAGLKSWFNRIIDGIKSIEEGLNNIKDEIIETIKTWIENIINAIKDMMTTLQTLAENIKNFFNEILNFIKNLPENIKKLIVPSEEFMQEYKTKWSEKFGIVNEIKQIIIFIKNSLESTKPPEIYINLPEKYGGKQRILNFDSLKPYRKDIQTFISAFLWINYSFLLFKKLPDIIGGAGMTTEAMSGINDEAYRYQQRHKNLRITERRYKR